MVLPPCMAARWLTTKIQLQWRFCSCCLRWHLHLAREALRIAGLQTCDLAQPSCLQCSHPSVLQVLLCIRRQSTCSRRAAHSQPQSLPPALSCSCLQVKLRVAAAKLLCQIGIEAAPQELVAEDTDAAQAILERVLHQHTSGKPAESQ